jgi:glycerol-3-phosphate acyltransferase PlsY
MDLVIAILVILAYLLVAFPFAVLIGRALAKIQSTYKNKQR